ncbi:glutathione S-transferase family protein [Alteriqipengyuania lutimaris]|uniref:Glutathione S-transferase family protein n=1 Tax=Alteriqipengyuania lutimaris TaxID=1538146 RepID=A0A395LT70_9SPHN|nr:glutathione S-transferase family protein [Alteriqipengyuania lutimaris]MBB3033222.1 glutathione S-transferase [Alteriqipengyuania lutimaris]RDS77730.1 glutathione S-transferase family protein [Alteriqipengyuania lutimaris]
MSMISPDAEIEITGYQWVPPFARGFVRDLRPRWACEEAGIRYRERLADVTDKPDWLLEAQPWGQVPVLRDGDIVLFESGATLLHLGRKSETLLPGDPQRNAEAISWLFGAFNSVEPWLFEWVNVTAFARDEEWARLRRPSLEEFIAKRLAPLERLLGGQNWLGETFTIADIAMVTVLRAIGGSDLLSPHPATQAYVARGEARPAFRQAMADQLAVFDRHEPPEPQGE